MTYYLSIILNVVLFTVGWLGLGFIIMWITLSCLNSGNGIYFMKYNKLKYRVGLILAGPLNILGGVCLVLYKIAFRMKQLIVSGDI